MTPDFLATIGQALYGQQWQSAVARDAGVNARTMRRYAAGTHPVPDAVVKRLAYAVDHRINVLLTILAGLDTH
jgi:hypothetical protein